MKRLALVALALCFLTTSAFAQSNTGRLVGTVSGPDGVIPNATVIVTSTQTNRERTLQTSDNGSFDLSQLDVGLYSVRVTATGFKTFTATDVKIDVGRDFNLNPTLEVGDVTEQVTVIAGADVVNSTTAELSETVTQRQIQELPLNGRNPLALIQLQAGVASNGVTTSINGQQSSFTNITRDGLNIQDNFIRSNAVDFVPDRPNVDDVGEFTITTQNAGVNLGYGSSQVQLVTPRGGSQYSGSIFEYNRNSKFASNTFLRNANSVQRPFLNRNQFGGRFGGPLPFPNFGEGGPVVTRDKAFFFGSYEGFRLRQSTSTSRTILLPDARNGIFTYVDNAGVTRTINVLTTSGVTADPLVASRFLANIPTTGNSTTLGDQRNTTGFNFNQLQNQDRESVTIRLDGDISTKQQISGVFGYRKEFLLRPDIEFGGGFNTTPFGFQDALTRSLVLAYRLTPTANFTNEVRGGVQDASPAFGRTNEPTNFFVNLSLGSTPESIFQAQGRNTEQYFIQDNANYVAGSHSINFGGQLQVFRINPFGPPAFSQSSIPTINLGTNVNTPSLSATQFPGGINAAQLGAANGLLALLGGFVSSVNQTFNATSQTSGFVQGALQQRNLSYENLGLYVGDQWRVTPNFTLNYGIRYEYFAPIRETDGRALEPVIPAGLTAIEAVLDPAGTYDFVGTNSGGTNFFTADKNNFAPNVSFAYSPRFKNNFLGSIFGGEEGKTVIRGGYNISYVNDEFVRGADNALAGNLGLTQTSSLINLNGRLSTFNPTIPTPAFQVPRTFAQNNLLAGRFGTAFGIDPNLKVPMIQQYNFGIQREIGFQTAVEFRYVGGRSTNLLRGIDYNQVDIFNNGFLADFNRARQNLILSGGTSGAFNPAIAGSQQLTVFPNLTAGGLLTNAVIRASLQAGTPADLALTYVTNNLAGTVNFLPNPNTGVADVLSNSARYNYNSFQSEFRRRFSQGFSFQANYTFQKTLTDTGGVAQQNFDPLLDLNNPGLEYQRADFDSAHIFNFNSLYELPFGNGKRFFSNAGGVLNRIIGGFQFTSIVRVASGPPLTITDARGTLNRAGRSGRQTALVNTTSQDLKNLFGVFRTPNGVFFINPTALGRGADGALLPGRTGRGADGFGTTPFEGQMFFNNAPGTTGNLTRAIFTGPTFFNIDASIIKNIPIKERLRFQIRAEAFNLFNRANFFVGNPGASTGNFDINGTNFGRINSGFDPRIIQFVGRIEF